MFSGLLVLLKLGFNVDAYYASEIDPDALLVTASHFGDRILQLGNVKDITNKTIKEIAPIDLLIGGSPCNDLSLANPARLGLHGPILRFQVDIKNLARAIRTALVSIIFQRTTNNSFRTVIYFVNSLIEIIVMFLCSKECNDTLPLKIINSQPFALQG